MKHKATRLDKNTVEYRGHYHVGRKKSFSLYCQAKAYVNLVEDHKALEAQYEILKEERKNSGHSQDLLDRENANYDAMREIDVKLSVIP